MDWKQKLKWKMLIILLAVIGILIVWQANRAGVRRQEVYRTQSLQENMIKENERASAGVTLPASSTDDTEEKDKRVRKLLGIQRLKLMIQLRTAAKAPRIQRVKRQQQKCRSLRFRYFL